MHSVVRSIAAVALATLVACAAAHRPTVLAAKPPPSVARESASTCASSSLELAADRERAVLRGIDFMAGYLAPDDRLNAVGVDAVQIFLELALTSDSESIRSRALPVARRHAVRMLPRYLAPDGLRGTWDVIDSLELLVDAPHLGIAREPLLNVLLTRFHSFDTDAAAYGIALDDPSRLGDEQAFDLLLAAYTFERADAAMPGLFPVRFRLDAALDAVWSRPLATRSSSDDAATARRAIDSAYLATHIALVTSEYGRRPLARESIGRFEFYLRAELATYMRARDVEIVGETADVLRQIGERDERSAELCAATHLLLETQNVDGSWGDWRSAGDPYDAIHKTWAAVTGLVARGAPAMAQACSRSPCVGVDSTRCANPSACVVSSATRTP